ncbi:MAG TPA: hypothetical protein VG308_03300 [Stellaceae bacterium]|jgi:hypothetical protein|nr:hypothetical protein [Stellaceae bacterium]
MTKDVKLFLIVGSLIALFFGGFVFYKVVLPAMDDQSKCKAAADKAALGGQDPTKVYGDCYRNIQTIRGSGK